MILQLMFLTVIKTTGSKEEKCFVQWGTSATCE